MNSTDESPRYPYMEDVNSVATEAKSVSTAVQEEAPVSTAAEPSVVRVQDVKALQPLLMDLSHNSWLQQYALNHFRDPDTIILRYGRSCIICSVVRHDLMQDTAVIVWAQNPEGFSAWTAINLVKAWAKDRGCNHLAAFIDMNSTVWKHMKAARRLTKMGPYKIVVSTGVTV